ncbi:unnamed protein product, partial [Prunus brigantina]
LVASSLSISLQGKLNRIDAQSTGNDAGLPPTHLISDSHQGFVATRINSPRGPGPSTHDSCLSILEAEESCHAFPFQKFSFWDLVEVVVEISDRVLLPKYSSSLMQPRF